MLQVLARVPGGQSIVAASQDEGEAAVLGGHPTEWPRDLDPYRDELGEVSVASLLGSTLGSCLRGCSNSIMN